MNILTFDIEEWYIEKKFHGARQEKYKEFDTYLFRILNLLDTHNIKATFFCVGRIATDFPYVVKQIASRGHEIGCHSNEHLWLSKMSPKELRQDTTEAVKSLEDVSGKKVISYRAPAFSIGDDNRWAIEILAECGIERDASIFPTKRDFGGFDAFPTSAPTVVEYGSVKIKEFPICLMHLFGRDIAYSGGGYFRFFPFRYVERQIKRSEYAICYFHIADLLQNKGEVMSRRQYETYFRESGTFVNRFKRYLKSNIGTKNALDKMERLIESIDFLNLDDADKLTDWNLVKAVKL